MFSELREKSKMIKGLRKATDVVIQTLGPKGKVIFINENGFVRPTKDGVTVAANLCFRDGDEDTGRALAVQAARKTVNVAGDGTTTTCLLLREMCEQESATWEEVAILESEVESICDSLKLGSQRIKTSEDLVKVANISANGDKSIGVAVGEMVFKLGESAQVEIKESLDGETRIEMSDGVKVNRGCHVKEWGSVTYQKSLVLVTDERISSIKQLEAILKPYGEACKAHGEQLPLLLFCDEMKGAALAGIIENREKFHIIPVGTPSGGVERVNFLNDVLTVTGASKVYKTGNGAPLKTITRASFGICEGFISTPKQVILKPKEDRMSIISNLVEEIRTNSAEDATEKKHNEDRVSALTSAFGTIWIAADSRSDFNRQRDVYEDAVLSCVSALKEGVVHGGGGALLMASKDANKFFKRVLSKPHQVIFGDIKLREYTKGEPLDSDIVDATEVVVSALKNSFSVWKNIALSSDTIIVKED